MRIDHLQFLIEIAKSKSISATAKKLYISQTGLSAIVNSIEAELNIQIFRRTNKGTLLTPEGEHAIKIMEEILEKNEELHYICSDTNQQHQIINLGIYPSAALALSRYLVKIWGEQHRCAHLHVYEIGYTELHNCINNHIASVVVGAEMTSRFHPASIEMNGKIYVEPLYTDHFYVLVSSRSELAQKTSIHLDEIIDRHILMLHNYPNPQDKPIGNIFHKFRYFTVLSSLELAKSILAEEPDKLMLTPSLSFYQDDLFTSGKLRALKVAGFETSMTIFLTCDITARLSIQETLMMQEIRNFFSGLPSNLK